MPKPLHEMDLSEVLEILNPTQKNSLLAYARQLARKMLSPNTNWVIDGRVQKVEVSRPAVLKTTESGKQVKCGRCGLRVGEKDIKKHWDSAHLTKKQKKHDKKKNSKS